MIPRKTILVLGAGASKEFDMPLGIELIDIVKSKLDFRWDYANRPIGKGDDYILHALGEIAGQRGRNRNDYTLACGKLREGINFSLSIDNYLHSHSDDDALVTAGKIGIAKAILESERGSRLWINPNDHESKFTTENVDNTWIYPFIKILVAGVTASKIEKIFDNLIVVCFNYDRCFEHALFESLKIAYAIKEDQAADIMSRLAILHPYGVVGKLPWQGGNDAVPFGDHQRRDLHRIAEDISLFTEQRSDPDFVDFVNQHVSSAERIMFLGFGYYKQNLDLISRSLVSDCRIAGSSFGLSPVDISSITSDIRRRFPIGESQVLGADLQSLKSFDMINAYSRFLADI